LDCIKKSQYPLWTRICISVLILYATVQPHTCPQFPFGLAQNKAEIKTLIVVSPTFISCPFISCPILPADSCRNLKFKPSIGGSSLIGHVIKTLMTESKNHCELKCYMEDDCISINFGPSLKEGKYLCELSDSDHEIHPEDLKPRTEFLYGPSQAS